MTAIHFGIVFLFIGVVLLACGAVASESIADSISNGTFGRYTTATTFCIAGGTFATIVGSVLMLLMGGRRGFQR